jgi:hypothetical protein
VRDQAERVVAGDDLEAVVAVDMTATLPPAFLPSQMSFAAKL